MMRSDLASRVRDWSHQYRKDKKVKYFYLGMYIIIYKYWHMYFGYELQKKQFRKLYYQNYETMTDRWQKMVIVITMLIVMRMMIVNSEDDGDGDEDDEWWW